MPDVVDRRVQPGACGRLVEALARMSVGADLWGILDREREHLLHCPACSSRLRQLARAALSPEEALTCAECQACWLRLSEKRSQPRSRELLSAAEHLRRCPACSEAYQRFVAMVQREEAGELAEPPSYPRSDLAFLAQRSAWQPGPASSTEAPAQVRVLASEVLVRVGVLERGAALLLEGLPTWLAPAPLPAPMVIRGKQSRQGRRLSLPDPESQVEVVLTMEPAGRGRVDLSIEVRPLSLGQAPLAFEASLRGASGWEVAQGRDGLAAFSALSPDRYEVTLRPIAGAHEGRLWQFLLEIAPSSALLTGSRDSL